MFRVAESITTVITPLDGIGWLRTTFAGRMATPLIEVMNAAALPTPSAFRSWLKSQKPNVPSALRIMFPELSVAKESDPARVVLSV